MMKRFFGAMAILLLLLPTVPATAKRPWAPHIVELKDFAKGKAAIHPDKGYIYFETTQNMAGAFLKIPNDQDFAEYDAIRQELYDKQKAKYDKKYARWEKANAKAKPPSAPPVAPRLEDIPMPQPIFFKKLDFPVGPKSGKSADGKRYFYLLEVEPGDYAFYGFAGGLGYMPTGTCFCMGTFEFSVAPGVITQLGTLFTLFPYHPVDPAKVVYNMPEQLSAYPSQPAELFAFGKIPNPYYLAIGRSPRIVGVLDYDRDIPIDLKADDDVLNQDVILARPSDAEPALVEPAPASNP